jgi:hypothetical protein
MEKKTRDLKKGDVITVEYGDFNNWVTCTMMENVIKQEGRTWKLITNAYGRETEMYSIDGDELVKVKE